MRNDVDFFFYGRVVFYLFSSKLAMLSLSLSRMILLFHKFIPKERKSHLVTRLELSEQNSLMVGLGVIIIGQAATHLPHLFSCISD